MDLLRIAARLAAAAGPTVKLVKSVKIGGTKFAQEWEITKPDGSVIVTSTQVGWGDEPGPIEHGDEIVRIGDTNVSVEDILGIVISSGDGPTSDGEVAVLDQAWIDRAVAAGHLDPAPAAPSSADGSTASAKAGLTASVSVTNESTGTRESVYTVSVVRGDGPKVIGKIHEFNGNYGRMQVMENMAGVSEEQAEDLLSSAMELWFEMDSPDSSFNASWPALLGDASGAS